MQRESASSPGNSALEEPGRRLRVEAIFSAHDVELAVVHGSRARGEGRVASDLDVGVLSRESRPLSYAVIGAIAVELSACAGLEVDVSDLSTPDAIFRYEVAKCARPIFQSRSDAFTDFLARAMIDYSDIQRFIPDMVAGVARKAREAGGNRRDERDRR
jgi:predicted nucleotidyltransferase